MTFLFRPAAAADVEEAYAWYEGQRIGLGEEFLAELGATLLRVRANPRQYPVIRRGTRRALLHRFPYGLFYRVIEEQILVVACMHAKRDPRRWQTRP
ncbi:MAG TPA: type II toxin-antitoxin system RelE/ParE family toxin [Candidatus Methylomirabilis sp.]|jgi:plasmid stabilization system protein ParE